MTLKPLQRQAVPRPGLNDNRGMALVVSLVLLVILTLVATAGMTTSTLQLRMAAGTQAATGAFQVAENAIETAVQCFRSATAVVVRASDCPDVATAAEEQYDFVIEGPAADVGTLLPEGVSLGTDLEALQFSVTATAAGRRGASAEVTQGFYVLGRRE